MKRIKIVCVVFLTFIILGSIYVYGENITKSIQVTYRNISILVNGKIVPSEQEPFIYQGRTFVPLRTIGEAVNKTVEWDNAKNQIIVSDPVNKVVRLGSYIELLNYLPDHFQYTKTDDKLTLDEINKAETFLEKLYKNDHKLNNEKPVLSSFHLTNANETITVFKINAEYRKGFLCFRYKDGPLYFIDTASETSNYCGSSDGWFIPIYSYNNAPNPDPSLLENYYMDYLTKIDYSIIKDSPNRTKQITDLYATSLWIARINLD
jgi:hypothetical protein